MSLWFRRVGRVVGVVGVGAALMFVTLLSASDAAPSEADAVVVAVEPAEDLESGAVRAGAGDAMAVWSAALVRAGSRTPSPEEAAAAPVPDAGSSPPAVVISVPPAEPEVPEVPLGDCSPQIAHDFAVTDASPVSASIEVSRAAFGCAVEVGLALAEDVEAISTLASRDIEGPLLLTDSELGVSLVEEIERLAPQRVVAAGIDEQLVADALSEFVVEHVEVGEWPPYERVWVVDDSDDAAALAAIAGQVGVGVVTATGDLRALPRSAREAIAAASEVEVLSDLGDDDAWQLDVILGGEELPGGGMLLFETGDDIPGRRLVAVYGHPSTGGLGVLGEQSPEDTVNRLQSIAEGYGADGSAVLPTFEIIATVASASAGADGDYSSVTDHEVIRPWIEVAAANGIYVVLDLQPGRSDFLSQAKHYEEFLRLPHVGLALDPEWRLKPHEVHLRQVGTVDAAEINQVVDWLAGIVREEGLPQKLLIVHQFRFSMITNREQIETPPELAVMIHMDGQGSLSAKYNTWNTLTGEADADRFYWGWKNFYDEDSPVATPEQVLARSPEIVYVSFQ